MAETKKEKNITFPLTVLKPIGDFLSKEAKRLEKQKQGLAQEDPFKDPGRVIDNASPDTEADEQFGHQKVVAAETHVNRRLVQIKKALTRLKIGKYGICEKCSRMIDTDRLMVMPETTICAKCALEKEK